MPINIHSKQFKGFLIVLTIILMAVIAFLALSLGWGTGEEQSIIVPIINNKVEEKVVPLTEAQIQSALNMTAEEGAPAAMPLTDEQIQNALNAVVQ